MNTFKKKSLYAALAGASALGVTGAAQAVNVNPDGLGQVLIYPYYTIQDKAPGAAFASLLSVVNSTASVKAVKVRFMEGKASQEVLDFNLFLSPRDVWTAAVLPTGDGAGVATFDTSCTVPVVSNNAKAPTPFVNFAYFGDGAGDGLERTKEGYVEIIEMGVPTDSTVITSITHVANGGKPPCTGISAANFNPGIAAPTGGLFGGMTLINVLAGEDYTSDAVALADFRRVGKYDQPGVIKPDLRDVSTAAVTIDNTSVVVSALGAFIQPIDAVSAILMHDHVYNEFVLDSGTVSRTDWIVTMPTKRYYYSDGATPIGGIVSEFGQVAYLFQRNFAIDTSSSYPTIASACDDVTLEVYDREEFRVPPGFSPPPRGGAKPRLCWEANVITFSPTGGVGSVFGSTNTLRVNTGFSNGWADLFIDKAAGQGLVALGGGRAHELFNFNSTRTYSDGRAAVTGSATYLGLPVIGFAAQSFTNGTLTDPTGRLVQSMYGGNFVHKTKRTINGIGTP